MGLEVIANLGLFAAGSFLIYKALTSTIGQPEKVEIPEYPNFYGDDPMTFQKELHTVNRLGPVKVNDYTGAGLGDIQVNGALWQDNPDLIYDARSQIPSTVMVGGF